MNYDATVVSPQWKEISKKQRYNIRHFVIRGYQYSLFTNIESEQPEDSWNEEVIQYLLNSVFRIF